MTRILVAGGTGALGRAVVAKLKPTDHRVRILSRKAAPADLESALEWAQGDVVRGNGLAAALDGVDILINCVGDAPNAYETDLLGVKRLAEMAGQAGVEHFFHVSIAGIDRMNFGFYRHKLDAEAAVAASGIPYSIQRITQFHTLLDFALSKIKPVPGGYALPFAGDARFQVIDTRDAADYLLPLALRVPVGRLPDVGGPDILRVDEMAHLYLQAQGVTDPVFVDPPQGILFSAEAVEAYRQGLNLVPDNRYGRIRWADYVREKFQGAP